MAHILLADDDAGLRELLTRALSSDGHTVSVATDGSEALDIVTKSGATLDILISDVDMPELDGLQLAHKALAQFPKLQIVMMSGLPDQLEKATKLGTGNVVIMAKPVTIEKMRQTINQLD